MRDKSQILNTLIDNDLSDVEVLREEKDLLFVNFYVDFDKDLLDAAKAYANDECKEDENSEAWLKEYYFQYLYDFANDEVLEIVEDISEEFEVASEFMAFEMKDKENSYVQFMIAITEENSDFALEEVVSEYINSVKK